MVVHTNPLHHLGAEVHRWGRLVRFSHTIFALPFAVAGVLYAVHVRGAWPSVSVWVWVGAAMVGARTAAMAFNRYADRKFDALNPRTRDREIPRGEVRPVQAVVLTVLGSALLVLSAWMLNPLCFALSPLALAIVLAYSLTKRFTWASHFVLGMGLGLAPLGAWIAVTGTFSWEICILSLGVLFWIAGLDVIYALQDESFDREQGLHSVPQRFGRGFSLRLSLICHVLCIVALWLTGLLLGLGDGYLVGLVLCAGVLAVEQSVARSDHPRRIQIAFFDLNGVFSVLHLVAVALGVFL